MVALKKRERVLLSILLAYDGAVELSQFLESRSRFSGGTRARQRESEREKNGLCFHSDSGSC